VFYWLAILITFALGTAAGDLVAESFDVGYWPSAVMFAVVIAVIARTPRKPGGGDLNRPGSGQSPGCWRRAAPLHPVLKAAFAFGPFPRLPPEAGMPHTVCRSLFPPAEGASPMVPLISLAALIGPQEHKPDSRIPRPLAASDLPELKDLYLQAYDPETEHSEGFHSVDRIGTIFDGVHGTPIPEASLLTVGADGRITGAIIITDRHVGSPGPGTAFIAELFTHPDHRRQGLAEDLLRHAMHVLHTLGHNILAVTVHSGNAAAMALYLSRDFRRLNQRTGND
jgi:ribosomal protein S18 acetylase RimI-like enzyme